MPDENPSSLPQRPPEKPIDPEKMRSAELWIAKMQGVIERGDILKDNNAFYQNILTNMQAWDASIGRAERFSSEVWRQLKALCDRLTQAINTNASLKRRISPTERILLRIIQNIWNDNLKFQGQRNGISGPILWKANEFSRWQGTRPANDNLPRGNEKGVAAILCIGAGLQPIVTRPGGGVIPFYSLLNVLDGTVGFFDVLSKKFPDANMVLRTDMQATKRHIIDEIKQQAARSPDDQKIIVILSMHGAKDGSVIPFQTENVAAALETLSAAEIAAAIGPTQQAIVVLDTCYGGVSGDALASFGDNIEAISFSSVTLKDASPIGAEMVGAYQRNPEATLPILIGDAFRKHVAKTPYPPDAMPRIERKR